jgi:hypothetical protein
VILARTGGPTHRYIGASPACWALFSALVNAGAPPLEPAPLNALISDAYAVQHPGVPSDQSIQSVAVHLLTLHGVLERGVDPQHVLWVRRRALREPRGPKAGRFQWLTPPSFAGSPTVADIARSPTPDLRSEQAERYVRTIWALWAAQHLATLTAWYDQFVLA